MSEIPMLYAVQWQNGKTPETSYHDTPAAADAEALRLVRSLPVGTPVTRFDLPEPDGVIHAPHAADVARSRPASPETAPNATDVIRGAQGDSEGVRA